MYSMGLSVSVIANWLAAIPRLVWPCVITAIYIPIAIVGASSFATSLENFLNVLGYWLSIYATVVIEEHFIFRKGRYENYEAASTWNRSDRLPVGFAAIAAGCCGAAGAVLGMAQAWFTGPSKFLRIVRNLANTVYPTVGKKVGGTADPSGGDIGWLLAFVSHKLSGRTDIPRCLYVLIGLHRCYISCIPNNRKEMAPPIRSASYRFEFPYFCFRLFQSFRSALLILHSEH